MSLHNRQQRSGNAERLAAPTLQRRSNSNAISGCRLTTSLFTISALGAVLLVKVTGENTSPALNLKSHEGHRAIVPKVHIRPTYRTSCQHRPCTLFHTDKAAIHHHRSASKSRRAYTTTRRSGRLRPKKEQHRKLSGCPPNKRKLHLTQRRSPRPPRPSHRHLLRRCSRDGCQLVDGGGLDHTHDLNRAMTATSTLENINLATPQHRLQLALHEFGQTVRALLRLLDQLRQVLIDHLMHNRLLGLTGTINSRRLRARHAEGAPQSRCHLARSARYRPMGCQSQRLFEGLADLHLTKSVAVSQIETHLGP